MTFGVGATATSATSPSAHDDLARGVSIGRLRMLVTCWRGSRRAPDLDVVGLAVAEDVADLLAGDSVAAARRTSPGLMP